MAECVVLPGHFVDGRTQSDAVGGHSRAEPEAGELVDGSGALQSYLAPRGLFARRILRTITPAEDDDHRILKTRKMDASRDRENARGGSRMSEPGYRELALKIIYPWICGRCAREFKAHGARTR